MKNKLQLTDINSWKKKLGLVPVPLFDRENPTQYVLLNGSRGNFCLDVSETSQLEDKERRSLAWSSNVGHYVAVTENGIEVQRWDKANATPLLYPHDRVYNEIETFHSYLERDFPRSEISIVSHAIQIFRRLRATLGETFDGRSSLGAFLCLIACIEDKASRDTLSAANWKLSDEAREAANSFSTANWDRLLDEFCNGRKIEELLPNITLLLRHASGKLFQEAHYEAIFVMANQLSLDGFLRSAIKIRKKSEIHGMKFTPSWLVRPVVEESFSAFGHLPNSVLIFDPACGSGEFLRECLRYLVLSGYPGQITLMGWDISEIACDMAKFILAWESRNKAIAGRVKVDIRCANSLDPDNVWPNNVDIVVMNPPFASWQDMNNQQRDNLAKILGRTLGQRSDLSHGFVLKSIPCLSDGGVLGTVLPASMLDGESAIKLRQDLASQMSPRLLARLGSQMLFPGALVDAALYVAKKEASSLSAVTAFWADYRPSSNSAGLRALRKARYLGDDSFFPINGDGYSIYKSETLGRTANTWAPRPYQSLKRLEALVYLPKVMDLFDVKQGTRTGLVKAFLLSKDEWSNLPKKERAYFRPAVVNKSIDHGYLKDICYCFYPYGTYNIDNENELAEKVKTYFNSYLLPNKERLLARARAKPDRWWGLSEHRRWQENRQPKLVSTYFGSLGSFAWDDKGDYVIVQGHAWLPKRRNLTEEATLAYLAILNSSFFLDLLSAVSNNLGGGQWNLSAPFVNQIALPDMMSAEIDSRVIRRLAEVGRSIHIGSPETDESTVAPLVRLVYRLHLDG